MAQLVITRGVVGWLVGGLVLLSSTEEVIGFCGFAKQHLIANLGRSSMCTSEICSIVSPTMNVLPLPHPAHTLFPINRLYSFYSRY